MVRFIGRVIRLLKQIYSLSEDGAHGIHVTFVAAFSFFIDKEVVTYEPHEYCLRSLRKHHSLFSTY